MADGDLTLKLDDETVERLRAAADAVGRTVQDYAAGLISEGLEVDWAEDLARIAEYDRTGESISVEEALDHFDRELESVSRNGGDPDRPLVGAGSRRHLSPDRISGRARGGRGTPGGCGCAG